MRNVAEQRGVTLVELLVTMVVAGILMAIVVPSFMGGKKTANRQLMVIAAQSYSEAVDSFRLDHGGRVPGAADWPNLSQGPVDRLMVPARPYMRSGVPEAYNKGLLRVSAAWNGSGMTSGAAPSFQIHYAPAAGGRTYTITATDLKTGRACQITNAGASTC